MRSGTYANTAQVMTSDQYDPDSVPGNSVPGEDDQDDESVTPQQADLSLVKTVDDPSPNVGDTVTFTLTVSNAGPDTATNISVEDTVPTGFTYVAASISGGDARDDSAAPLLTWTINSLASGASVDLTFQAEVLASGDFTNVAAVTASDQYDPDPTNNTDSETATPQIADLSLVKTVDDPSPNVGDTVTFTLTVSNAGPDTATNISVEDTVPTGFTYVAASISGGDARDDSAAPLLTWTINSLASGASVDLTFQAEVLASGDFTNVAAVTASDQYDPDPTNNTDSETATPQIADLSLVKTVDDASPNVGDTVTFTMTVSNAGPSDASGVSVNDVIPDGYSYVAGSIAGGDGRIDATDPILSWSIISLASGASTDLTFQAEVLGSGNYVNTAQVMAADQYDPDSLPGNSVPGEDDQDTESVTPQQADLSLVKTVDNPSPNVGDTVTFTMTVANAGPDTATGISVEDTVPTGFTYVAASISGGDANDDSAAPLLTWTINSLASGASMTSPSRPRSMPRVTSPTWRR